MNARVIPLLGILLLGVTTAATAQDRLPSVPQTLSLQDALELAVSDGRNEAYAFRTPHAAGR